MKRRPSMQPSQVKLYHRAEIEPKLGRNALRRLWAQKQGRASVWFYPLPERNADRVQSNIYAGEPLKAIINRTTSNSTDERAPRAHKLRRDVKPISKTKSVKSDRHWWMSHEPRSLGAVEWAVRVCTRRMFTQHLCAHTRSKSIAIDSEWNRLLVCTEHNIWTNDENEASESDTSCVRYLLYTAPLHTHTHTYIHSSIHLPFIHSYQNIHTHTALGIIQTFTQNKHPDFRNLIVIGSLLRYIQN